MRRWARRIVTFSAYAMSAAVLMVALPLLAPLALLVDMVQARRFVLTRSLLFFATYFSAELLGLIAAGGLWLGHAASGFRNTEAFLRRNYALQRAWSQVLFDAAARIFEIQVHGAGSWQGADRRPFLLMVRHASVADTLLPSVLFANRARLRLRYVLKRELLWDPCLDVVGNRLPNAFVRRSGDARDIERVRSLATGLTEGEGLMLYPEGTRFTRGKRARLIESLQTKGETALAARAAGLRHTLPPRLGGVMAMLDAAPELDVVFCAHHGFDAVRSMADLFDGRLVGVEVNALFWRVPAKDIPTSEQERVEWLFENWRRVDAFVGRCASAAPQVVGDGVLAEHPSTSH